VSETKIQIDTTRAANNLGHGQHTGPTKDARNAIRDSFALMLLHAGSVGFTMLNSTALTPKT